MNAHQNCASCAYFQKQGAEQTEATIEGVCRRNAPRPDSAVRRAEWPKVHGKDWCGEWKSRNNEL